MSFSPGPESDLDAESPAPPRRQDDHLGHRPLALSEAAVVIALVGAVTVLTLTRHPVPAVLVWLCTAAGALMARSVRCRLGYCGGGAA